MMEVEDGGFCSWQQTSENRLSAMLVLPLLKGETLFPFTIGYK